MPRSHLVQTTEVTGRRHLAVGIILVGQEQKSCLKPPSKMSLQTVEEVSSGSGDSSKMHITKVNENLNAGLH